MVLPKRMAKSSMLLGRITWCCRKLLPFRPENACRKHVFRRELAPKIAPQISARGVGTPSVGSTLKARHIRTLSISLSMSRLTPMSTSTSRSTSTLMPMLTSTPMQVHWISGSWYSMLVVLKCYILCYIVSCTMPYYAVLTVCCAIPHTVVHVDKLHHAMLQYAMLCYAMLWSFVHSSTLHCVVLHRTMT